MQELTVKEVNFNGDTLLALENKGKIFVGVKWICDGLGLSKGQSDNQVKKINGDPLLNQGASKMTLETNGINNEVMCIELDFLPIWLAKINASIIKDDDVKEKVIKYQLKAKDVLKEAFIENRPPQTYLEALQELVKSEQQKLILQPKAEKYDRFISGENLQKLGDVGKIVGMGRNRLFSFLREQKILMKNNVPYQQYIDRGYFEVKETPVNMGGQTINKPQTYATAKGVDYIDSLIQKKTA